MSLKNENKTYSMNKILTNKLQSPMQQVSVHEDYKKRLEIVNQYRRLTQLPIQRVPDHNILKFCSTATDYQIFVPDGMRFFKALVSGATFYIQFGDMFTFDIPTLSGEEQPGNILQASQFYIIDDIKVITVRATANAVLAISFYKDL